MLTCFSRELIERIALYADGVAYKQFFYYYYPRLVGFSESFLHNRESAEEVVSDVFTKIWNNRASLTGIENIHLYLYVVTKNLSLNRLVKEKRNLHTPIDDSHVALKSMYYDPEQLLITAEMFKKIQKAILQLPPKCQLIFKLVKEDGLSYKQVSQLLGLSIKTVENQMTIAIKKLAASIRFKEKSSLSI